MRVLAVFGLLLSLSTFSAERAKWGVSGYGTLFWNCTQGFCTGNDNDVYQSIDQSFASNLVLNCEASFGSVRMDVEMRRTGDLLLPRITGHARSNGSNYHWNDGSAIVIEGIRYVGPTNTTLLFDGLLHGRTTGTRNFEGLRGEVYFFKSEGFRYEDHLGTLLYETDAQLITNVVFQIRGTNSGAHLQKRFEIPVVPNETIYMYAALHLDIFQVIGSTETLDGFEVVCETPENLESESLRVDHPLEIASATDALTLTIPASRKTSELQQVGNLGQQWTSAQGTMVTNEFGKQMTVPKAAGTQFWRVKWD